MKLTDKLDGIVIERRFSVTNDAGVTVDGCNVVFMMDGITLKEALADAGRSLVIKIQNPCRNLSAAEIKKAFVDQPYVVHASNAGKKIASPEQRKQAADNAIEQLPEDEQDQVFAEKLGVTVEEIRAMRAARK